MCLMHSCICGKYILQPFLCIILFLFFCVFFILTERHIVMGTPPTLTWSLVRKPKGGFHQQRIKFTCTASSTFDSSDGSRDTSAFEYKFEFSLGGFLVKETAYQEMRTADINEDDLRNAVRKTKELTSVMGHSVRTFFINTLLSLKGRSKNILTCWSCC